jgi:cell division protein FtsX
MGRLFLIVLLAAVFVAIVAILVSVWNAAVAAGTERLRPYFNPDKDGMMAPSGFQKVAFVALIVVLFGVTAGWLGGL